MALLTGSDRITLDLDGDRFLVSWMDGLPQPLSLGKRSHRVELPTGEHMRIRAWEEPYEDGALVVRRVYRRQVGEDPPAGVPGSSH